MSRCGIIHATHEGRRWTLRLEDDEGPAFVRLGTWRLTHLESAAPWMRELKTRLTANEGGDEAEVVAQVSRALLDLGACDISIRWRDAAFTWPTWPEALRLGFPSAGGLWPADFELLGLWLGTRRVAKRDGLTDEARRARVQWWRSAGLSVGEVDGVVFGALDEATVHKAVAAQHALTHHENSASRDLGDALGYPRCCVDAYLSLGPRDDDAMLDARPSDVGPPENGFLIGPLAILSHTPCRAHCPASLRLARRLLRGMDARSPGFETRWRRVATGVWGLDSSGGAWVFGGGNTVERAGKLDGGVAEALRFRGEALSECGPASLPLTFHADHRRTTP